MRDLSRNKIESLHLRNLFEHLLKQCDFEKF